MARRMSSLEQGVGSAGSRKPFVSVDRYWVRFYGPFAVFKNDEELGADALKRPKTATLLKWFLLHPNKVVTSRELTDILWPDRQVGSVAPSRVHNALHHLRHAVEPALGQREQSRYFRGDGHGAYWFDPCDRWDTDILLAERHLAAADDHGGDDDDRAVSALEQYLRLTESGFLPEDLYGENFQEERSRQENQYRDARSRLLALYMRHGLCHKALSVALTASRTDPYDEDAALVIARVHLRTGNAPAATKHLEQFITLIRTDLGVAPGPRTVQLLSRIRDRQGTGGRPGQAGTQGRRPR